MRKKKAQVSHFSLDVRDFALDPTESRIAKWKQPPQNDVNLTMNHAPHLHTCYHVTWCIPWHPEVAISDFPAGYVTRIAPLNWYIGLPTLSWQDVVPMELCTVYLYLFLGFHTQTIMWRAALCGSGLTMLTTTKTIKQNSMHLAFLTFLTAGTSSTLINVLSFLAPNFSLHGTT